MKQMLLCDELSALEAQIDELRRSQAAREQLDLQRLDSLWHMAQVRLLSQSHWWRGVMVAAKDDDPPVCPTAAADRGRRSGALPDGVPSRRGRLRACAVSRRLAAARRWARGRASVRRQRLRRLAGGGCRAPGAAGAARRPAAALGAREGRPPPEEAEVAAESEAAAAAAAAAVAAEVAAEAAAEATTEAAREATEAAASSDHSLASGGPRRQGTGHQGTDSPPSRWRAWPRAWPRPAATWGRRRPRSSSTAARTAAAPPMAARAAAGMAAAPRRSVDGDGSADMGSNHGSNPDDSTAEAAAGLLFGIERASRPTCNPRAPLIEINVPGMFDVGLMLAVQHVLCGVHRMRRGRIFALHRMYTVRDSMCM